MSTRVYRVCDICGAELPSDRCGELGVFIPANNGGGSVGCDVCEPCGKHMTIASLRERLKPALQGPVPEWRPE
jgi:hypothetical protein